MVYDKTRPKAFGIALTLLLAGAVIAKSTIARDIYVSNTAGNDQMDGSAPRLEAPPIGPVRTLTRALQLAAKGDRISVDNTGQPYRESISLSGQRHRGLPGQPLTLLGNGATLDGTVTVPPKVWQHFRGDVFRFRPRRLAHQQLLLRDQPARRQPVADRRVLPPLAPLEWTLLDGHVYFRVEAGKLPRDYDLKHSGHQTGITLYNVAHVRIHDFTVRGFELDGVNAHDGVRDAVLEGLTCCVNGRSGVSVGGASRVTIQQCQLIDNGRSQFRIEGHSTAWLNQTQIDTTSAPGIRVEGGRLLIDGKIYSQDPTTKAWSMPGPTDSLLPDTTHQVAVFGLDTLLWHHAILARQ